MFSQLMPALRMLVVLTVLTGLVYPLLVTGVARLAFPHQASGSLIVVGDKTMGSELLGQPFDDPKYFWSRPSATSPQPYNGAASSGSNQGARNPALADAVKERIKALQRCRSRQHRTRAGGSGHCIGEWARPAYQRCSRQLSGVARGQSARHPARTRTNADRPACRRPYLRGTWRTSRQRTWTEHGPRPDALAV